MGNDENMITLYPSSWYYNSLVVGFLTCLDGEGYLKNSYKGKNINLNKFPNAYWNISHTNKSKIYNVLATSYGD